MSKTHPDNSIIMPVYNAARYLKKAIESCLEQTIISSIELILIDDHSQDNSVELIRMYSERYPDIITAVYLDKNGGQGAARNIAISHSRGEYLLFVDSDDWIEPNTCEKMYEAAICKNADLVGADYYIHEKGNTMIRHLNYKSINDPKSEKQALAEFIMDSGFFWSRMYKKSIFTDENIEFPTGVLYEDSYVNFMAAMCANKIIKISGQYYHYSINDYSSCHKQNDPRHYDREKIINLTYRSCIERGIYNQNQELVDLKCISMVAGGVYEYINLFDKPEPERLKGICDSIREKTPEFRNNRYYGMIPRSRRILLEACMISPSLAILLFRIRRIRKSN